MSTSSGCARRPLKGPNILVRECSTRDNRVCKTLVQDPALPGVGAVVLDEFHERSVDADLALSLCAASQAGPRPDLRCVSARLRYLLALLS